jgi:hypothetical protein
MFGTGTAELTSRKLSYNLPDWLEIQFKDHGVVRQMFTFKKKQSK